MKLDIRKYLIIFGLVLSTGFLQACEDEGAFEETGEAIDEAADDAADGLDDAADDLEDSVN